MIDIVWALITGNWDFIKSCWYNLRLFLIFAVCFWVCIGILLLIKMIGKIIKRKRLGIQINSPDLKKRIEMRDDGKNSGILKRERLKEKR